MNKKTIVLFFFLIIQKARKNQHIDANNRLSILID